MKKLEYAEKRHDCRL